MGFTFRIKNSIILAVLIFVVVLHWHPQIAYADSSDSSQNAIEPLIPFVGALGGLLQLLLDGRCVHTDYAPIKEECRHLFLGSYSLVFFGATASVLLKSRGKYTFPLNSGNGCAILLTRDGYWTIQGHFQLAELPAPKDSANYFSLADNGIGTVVWGLFDYARGEEWESGAPGEVSITGFVRNLENATDVLNIKTAWASMATENFSGEVTDAQIEFECFFFVKPF